MNFTSARAIEAVCYQMRLADWPRGLNRARINSLANGAAPYTVDEATRNAIEVNVNDLSLTRLSHDARMQLYQAFNKPGNFFTASTDAGTVAKRRARSITVTKEVTRQMKRSDAYFECMRSKFALLVLHGIGPSNWEGPDRWRDIPLGIEDVFVPGNTTLPVDDLPFFAISRRYTAARLRHLTRYRDKASGWNLDAVDRALRWADEQSGKLCGGSNWSEYWSPEKQQERFKQDSGIYASDLVPTIDCIDFYYWDDAGRHEGWRRRIVFDAWGGYNSWNGPTGYGSQKQMPSKNLIGDDKGMFLFDSGNRVFAEKVDQILHFQFADLSAPAPFHYHSIRGLGFLLFAPCHLQNRLRCSFSEAVFENMMMYLRANSEEEAQKALYVTLANRKFIDSSIQFVPAAERWQPNYQLAELGLSEFKQIIADNSSSYVQDQAFGPKGVEKTKFEVMARVNAMQTLVSSALQQAYRYQQSEFREIFRRFMRRNSLDPDVNEFRARCLARDVPDKYLVADAWDIEPERIMGGGNKTLEMAIAQQLWEMRTAFSPEAQQQIQRDVVLAITDDAARADSLVPASPGISDDRHDAMIAFGTLMVGAAVQLTKSQSRIEVVQTWLAELAVAVQRAGAMGNMVSPDKLAGFQNVLEHVGNLLGEIGADRNQKETANKLAEISGKLANLVKGFAQRLEQQMKAQQGEADDGGEMAKTKAKIAGTILAAKVKAESTRESHAQKTAQRQVSFEAKEQQQEQQHQLELRREVEKQQVEDVARGIEAAAKVRQAQLDGSAKEGE